MTPESQETPHPARTFDGTLARDMHDCLRPTTRGYHPLAGRQAPAGSRCDATYWRQSHGRGRRAPLTPEPDRRGTSTASRARRPTRITGARTCAARPRRVRGTPHRLRAAGARSARSVRESQGIPSRSCSSRCRSFTPALCGHLSTPARRDGGRRSRSTSRVGRRDALPRMNPGDGEVPRGPAREPDAPRLPVRGYRRGDHAKHVFRPHGGCAPDAQTWHP